MKTKNLYSFLLSFLVIPFSANLGIIFFTLSSDIALFKQEAKATNRNAYKLNFDNGYRMLGKGEYQKALEYFNKAIKTLYLSNMHTIMNWSVTLIEVCQ